MRYRASSAAGSRVQEAVDRLVADGGEVGPQVAVIHRGDLVVDAVSSLADAERGMVVTPDTLFFAPVDGQGYGLRRTTRPPATRPGGARP